MTADSFLKSIAREQAAALQKFGIRIAVDVVDEPISLADAYAHLHIDSDSNGSAEDTWLDGQIPAAREYCEAYLGRALAPRTFELAASAFPSIAVATPPGACFVLPFGPVTAIESITYLSDEVDSSGDLIVDSAGAPIVLEFIDTNGPLYELDPFYSPARVILKYGESWPTVLSAANSVKVRYTAGYVRDADSSGSPVLPRLARAAMLLMLGCAYLEREGKDYDKTLTAAHALLDLVPNRERLGFA